MIGADDRSKPEAAARHFPHHLGHYPMRGPRGGRLGLGRATSRSQGRLTETRPPATAMRNARRFITHSRLAMSPRRDRARRPAGSTLLQPSHVRELPTAPARLFCRPCSRPVGLTSRVAQSPPTLPALWLRGRLAVPRLSGGESTTRRLAALPSRNVGQLVRARARGDPRPAAGRPGRVRAGARRGELALISAACSPCPPCSARRPRDQSWVR